MKVYIVAKRDGWVCYYCRVKLVPKDKEHEYYELLPSGKWKIRDGYRAAELEHKNPRCKGGGDEIDNLVLACGNCNRSKGRKTESEFIERLRRMK